MLPSPFKASDTKGNYLVNETLTEEAIFKMANYLAKQRLKKGRSVSSPDTCVSYLQTQLQTLEREVFGVIFLDQQHRIITQETLFYGTINQASVYPREIVKSALNHNAAAVILFHNHPSGATDPSPADDQLTQQIKKTLDLIEVHVLDHLILGVNGHYSYAQTGKI
ncbi:MAG: DNA repair protein RadC [Thiotrichales bacterium]|nr:DNA repair protein RadC [Thiotrichales bacterium]